MFNLLTRVLPATAGRIVFKGEDVGRLRPAEVARLGMVRSFQVSAVFPKMTVLDNVRVALQRRLGGSYRFWLPASRLSALDERALELLAAVDLAGLAGTPAVELPYGKKRALELATTLALEPDLLLLDEPTQGMGHEDVGRVAALIRKASAGRTVLMVEHNLSVVADLCGTISVLARGRVIAEGGYDEVARDRAVIEAYLGVPA